MMTASSPRRRSAARIVSTLDGSVLPTGARPKRHRSGAPVTQLNQSTHETCAMTRIRKPSPHHYRFEIRQERWRAIALEVPRRFAAAGLRPWLQRYHLLICEYLLVHLARHELREWRAAYIALHEFVGTAWASRIPGADCLEYERLAWRRLQPRLAFGLTGVGSRLPSDFSHKRFLHHYRGFLHFAASKGALDSSDVTRLTEEVRETFAARVRLANRARN